MKKILTSLFLVAACTFVAAAQDQPAPPPHGKMDKHPPHGDAMKALDLTKEQRDQMKSVHESYRAKFQDLAKQDQITVKEMRERRAALAKEQKTALDNILTPEQKAKRAEMMKKGMQKREEMAGHQFDQLKEKLALTDDQSKSIKALNDSYRSKVDALRKDDSINPEDKKEQVMALRKEQKEKMNALLTPEQQEKMKSMRPPHHRQGPPPPPREAK